MGYMRTDPERTSILEPPRTLVEERIGALRCLPLELAGGRIVMPYHHRVRGRSLLHNKGTSISAVIYSDDGGATWSRSPSRLTSPCAPGYNGNTFGRPVDASHSTITSSCPYNQSTCSWESPVIRSQRDGRPLIVGIHTTRTV